MYRTSVAFGSAAASYRSNGKIGDSEQNVNFVTRGATKRATRRPHAVTAYWIVFQGLGAQRTQRAVTRTHRCATL